ncbi:alpha/beta hydrolase [Planctomycetota bacterium]|nr:alpha/beta hydrolase [Planctomycetota bacterium]
MATEVQQVPEQQKSKYRGALKRMIWFFVIVFICWASFGCVMQRMVLWPRWAIGDVGPGISDTQAQAMNTDVLWLQQGNKPDKKTEAWFLKGQGVSPQNPGPVVIFAHGNGEVIDHWAYDLNEYRKLGISVLLVEFRGYGRSDGSPTENRILTDYIAAYDLIVKRPDVDPDRIISHGRSIGGGISAQLAQSRSVSGLILQSTFTGVAPLARRYLIPKFMLLDKLEVNAVLKDYDKPVLIMHGRDDEIIPASHARQNHAVLKPEQSTLVIFDNMGHNTPPPDHEYWQQIRAFLKKTNIID